MKGRFITISERDLSYATTTKKKRQKVDSRFFQRTTNPGSSMLRRVFQIAAAVIALAAAPQAEAAWQFRVQTALVNVAAPVTAARLVPNATWSGGYNTSGGSAPVADGVLYGAQTITAVGIDSSMSGGNVPQLKVASTATMREGEEWRVGSTALAGLDNMWKLHVVDATTVDLCTNLDFSGSGASQCTVNTTERPSTTTAGYTGSPGTIWFDETPAARFDEHPNAWVEGSSGDTITVGAGTSSRSWIKSVKFCLDADLPSSCTTVTQQQQNTARQYGSFPAPFGWLVNVQSRGMFDSNGPQDGLVNLYAVVTPVNGLQRVIGPLPLVLNTNGTIATATRYVSNAVGSESCDGLSSASGASPDANGHCAWKSIDKATCNAGTIAAGGVSVTVHVAGGTVPGGAGTMYKEPTGACGNTPVNTEYPVRFVADGPVYVTSGTGDYGLGTWNIHVQKAEFNNGFFVDSGSNTSIKIQASNGMFWLGKGGGLVEARGDNNQLVGSRGPAYGWSQYWNGQFPTYNDPSDFFGIGEVTVNTLAANGFELYRNVSGTVALDVFRHPTSAASDPMAIFNYAAAATNSNVQRMHTEQTITVQSAACVLNAQGTYSQEVVTFTTNPVDGIGIGAPSWLTVLTGNGGVNNGNNPYISSGTTGTFAVSTGDGTAQTLTITNDSGHNQPCSSFNFQPGDTAVGWVESHGDCGQTTLQADYAENWYMQNYHCTGFNSQPMLYQQNHNDGTYTISTSGLNWSAPSGVVYNVKKDDFLINQSFNNGGTYAWRRVASITKLVANFSAYFSAGTTTMHISNVTGTIYPGMGCYYDPSGLAGAYSGYTIVSQINGTTGGAGDYTMNKSRGNGTVFNFYGVGSVGGTLVGSFPQDLTSASLTVPSPIKDVACVNCIVDGYNGTGVQGQYQEAERNITYNGYSQNTSPFQGTVSLVTLYNSLAAESDTFMDAVVGNVQRNGSPSTAYFGVGVSLFNVLTTTTTGNPKITDGSKYLSGVTFTAGNLLNPLSGIPVLNADAVASRPWDINGFPTFVGAPIGAVVH